MYGKNKMKNKQSSKKGYNYREKCWDGAQGPKQDYNTGKNNKSK